MYTYLATSHEAINVVVAVEIDQKELPIYFVSRSLQGSKLNYPTLEKLVLSLVHTTKRLQRYFQAHHIKVLTTQPIHQIVSKPEKYGRLAKWAIELGEHDIEYRPKLSIKAQSLADFLVEFPTTEKTRWSL